MTKQEFHLGRGIRLHTVQTRKFKVSRLSVSFICKADSLYSPLTKLMFSVLLRGSEKYPTVTQINKRLDELYGSTVSFRCLQAGKRHIFKIICEFLDESYIPQKDIVNTFSGTLEVIKDILFHPKRNKDGKLDNAYIDSEKKIAIDGIRAKINDQRAYSAERCRQILFGSDPRGILIDGTEDMINEFNADDVERCLSVILDKALIECFYVGPEDGENIADSISSLFEEIKFRGAVSEIYSYKAFSKKNNLSEVTERLPVSQGRLNIGFICDTVPGDDRYFSMCLFNEIFGGSSVSKLFMNVREKKSLCYYCSSDYMKSSGVILVSCGIKSGNRDIVYKEIMSQLESIKMGNISDEELNSAKKILTNALKQVDDSTAAIESYNYEQLLAGTEMDTEYCLRKINEVTKAEIAGCAELVYPNAVFFLCGEDTI